MQDVDVLVLHAPHKMARREWEIKNMIVEADDHERFYLKTPRDPTAPYRILIYREKPGRECKVDIVIPGIMHLPNISPDRLIWTDGLPLVPYQLLLLQKLQAWDDHRTAREVVKREKSKVDAEDVKRLVNMSQGIRLRTIKNKPWDDEELFTPEFMTLTLGRVKEFCVEYPECANGWKAMGFSVDRNDGAA